MHAAIHIPNTPCGNAREKGLCGSSASEKKKGCGRNAVQAEGM